MKTISKTVNPQELVHELIFSDLTMNELIHTYDPVKAREYYLRTRQLKGRQKAGINAPGVVRNSAQEIADKKAAALKKRKDAEARVAALKSRLEVLKKVLAELVKEAKVRSGIESKPSTTPKKVAEKEKPKTAVEKRKAAEQAKKYREENKKDPTPSQEQKDLEEKIKKVQARIANMRKQIAAAKKRAKDKEKGKI